MLQSRVLGKGIVVLGLSAAVMALAARFASRARVSSLCSEVDSLNETIAQFLTRGGCLSGIRGIEAILDRLKGCEVGIDQDLTADG